MTNSLRQIVEDSTEYLVFVDDEGRVHEASHARELSAPSARDTARRIAGGSLTPVSRSGTNGASAPFEDSGIDPALSARLSLEAT